MNFLKELFGIKSAAPVVDIRLTPAPEQGAGVHLVQTVYADGRVGGGVYTITSPRIFAFRHA